jgi:hypothetical protein
MHLHCDLQKSSDIATLEWSTLVFELFMMLGGKAFQDWKPNNSATVFQKGKRSSWNSIHFQTP